MTYLVVAGKVDGGAGRAIVEVEAVQTVSLEVAVPCTDGKVLAVRDIKISSSSGLGRFVSKGFGIFEPVNEFLHLDNIILPSFFKVVRASAVKNTPDEMLLGDKLMVRIALLQEQIKGAGVEPAGNWTFFRRRQIQARL